MMLLWELYDKTDNKQQKLLIYTLLLLQKLHKNQRILHQFDSYNKEEVKELQTKLQSEVSELLNEQYNHIVKLIENSLISSYQEAEKILNESLGVNSSLTLQEIKNLINETWVGTKNFKERLEWNLQQILKKYEELLENDVEVWELKKLQENYFYRLRRLLDTETHRDINQACLNAYRIKGIEFVEWIAHMDERTCPICRRYDRQIYMLEDAPFCPDHPFCRCILIPSTKEDYVKWISRNMA